MLLLPVLGNFDATIESHLMEFQNIFSQTKIGEDEIFLIKL